MKPRKDHRGRFTSGRRVEPANEPGAPLLCLHVKSAPHVRAEATKRERQRAKVWRVKMALDRELGR